MIHMTEWKTGDKCAVRLTNSRYLGWYVRGTVTRVTKTLIFVNHNNSERKYRKDDSALCELTPEIKAELRRQADAYRLSRMTVDDWRSMSGDKLARIVAILEEESI